MKKYKEAILLIIAIIAIVVFIGTKIQPKIVELINIENDLKTKTVELDDLTRKLETLKQTEKQKEMMISKQSKKIYKPAESGMDTESSFTITLDDLIEMAKYNGIRIFSIEYAYNPPTDDFVKGAPGQYDVCQLNMNLIGDYVDMQSFLKDIYKYPYLMSIDKLELTPYQKNKKILIAKLQLKLYSQK